MASRSLNDLCPPVRDRAHQFTSRCDAEDIHVIITCTRRSADEQAALYAQGRMPLAQVSALRRAVGLAPISEAENRHTVTDAVPGDSYHQYDCAFDVAIIEGGKCVWDPEHPSWARVGKIGRECELEWAGDWTRRRECPHFQFTGGLTLAELREGKRPV